jgi:transcriptional regulator with XRE-family HTH domain
MKKRVRRGFLASKDGLNFLERKKFELNLSYEEIVERAGLVSEDQVKRLFNPHWERRVQRDTIDKIATVLGLNSVDIIETEESVQLESLLDAKPTSVVMQKMLSDIESDGDLEADDVVQNAPRGSSVEQILATHLKVVGNIKFGSLTQES